MEWCFIKFDGGMKTFQPFQNREWLTIQSVPPEQDTGEGAGALTNLMLHTALVFSSIRYVCIAFWHRHAQRLFTAVSLDALSLYVRATYTEISQNTGNCLFRSEHTVFVASEANSIWEHHSAVTTDHTLSWLPWHFSRNLLFCLYNRECLLVNISCWQRN
jgi:hypothetical protein